MSLYKPTKTLLRLAVATGLLGGCGDATGPGEYPDALNDGLILYAVLNADSTRHVVQVAAADYYSRPKLSGVRVTIHQRNLGSNGPMWNLVAVWDSARAAARGASLTDRDQCWRPELEAARMRATTSIISTTEKYCMAPEARLEPGATYRVEAKADGRIPASGETVVVGDFAVESATISGSQGKYTLSSNWTPSNSAHRYFVGIRLRITFCGNCNEPWYTVVDGRDFAGNVPDLAVDSAGPGPMLDVAAVDKHLHDYLTTGHRGNLHAVHPVQNVQNGYGVVGSATYRSRRLATSVGSPP